jgi:hypothetical protein
VATNLYDLLRCRDCAKPIAPANDKCDDCGEVVWYTRDTASCGCTEEGPETCGPFCDCADTLDAAGKALDLLAALRGSKSRRAPRKGGR